MENIIGIGLLASLVPIGLLLYFLPGSVAEARGHPQKAPIAIINLFFGWTLLGWVISLAWSMGSWKDSPHAPNPTFGKHYGLAYLLSPPAVIVLIALVSAMVELGTSGEPERRPEEIAKSQTDHRESLVERFAQEMAAGDLDDARDTMERLRSLQDPPEDIYEMLNRLQEAEIAATTERARRAQERASSIPADLPPDPESDEAPTERSDTRVPIHPDDVESPEEWDIYREDFKVRASRAREKERQEEAAIQRQMEAWWPTYDRAIEPLREARSAYRAEIAASASPERATAEITAMREAAFSAARTLTQAPDPRIWDAVEDMLHAFDMAGRTAEAKRWHSFTQEYRRGIELMDALDSGSGTNR